MAKRKKSTVSEVPSTSKSVDIKKISNGYVVSTWGGKGQKEKFAKSLKEAKAVAGRMF